MSKMGDHKIDGYFDYVVPPLEGFWWQDGIEYSRAEFLTVEEGFCVQILHHGSYDDEPASVELMYKFVSENGYELDFSESGFESVATGVLTKRLHHEIYLSDPRKCETEKLKTVIRLPIKKI